MAYGTPTNPVAGTVITVAYAIANILDPIRALRANTGAADPPAANRVAVSTGVGGPTSWQQIQTDTIGDRQVTGIKLAANSVGQLELIDGQVIGSKLADNAVTLAKMADNSVGQAELINGQVTDVKLASQKVNIVNPAYANFGAASQNAGSGFYDIGQGTSPPDAPVAGEGWWWCIQNKHGNWGSDYRMQIAIPFAGARSVEHMWVRAINNGVSGAWARIWNSANDGSGSGLDAGLFEGRDYASAKADIIASVPGGTVEVPPNVIAMYLVSTTPPTGWAVETGLYDRIPGGINAGGNGTFGAINSVGGVASHGHDLSNHAHDYNHTHGVASHTHGSSALSVTGSTGNESNAGQSGGTGTNRADSPHTHGVGTLDVAGSTDGQALTTNNLGTSPVNTGAPSNNNSGGASHLPPYRAVLYIKKT